MENSNKEGLTHLSIFGEFCNHRGRIYVSENDYSKYVSTVKMAIYNPSAGKWDIQNPKTKWDLLCSSGHRFVSYGGDLWIFRFIGDTIYTHTYDSYLHKWNISGSLLLDNEIEKSSLTSIDFTDVAVL